jgi:DDE superfamily endonuclease
VVGNVRSYFLGHYQRYGVNIEACCDHPSWFTYISVAGLGAMNDNQATNEVDIAELISNLPFSFCVIGNAAYSPTESLVPMFYGPDKQRARFNNFNFYASQLCIRIKMAFSMMQCKWVILWRPLIVPLGKIKYIVEVIARLHNFCIDERKLERGGGNVNPVIEANVAGRGTFEDLSEALAKFEAILEDLPGYSGNREQMVRCIEQLGLTRIDLKWKNN